LISIQNALSATKQENRFLKVLKAPHIKLSFSDRIKIDTFPLGELDEDITTCNVEPAIIHAILSPLLHTASPF